jgi:hypothetical protein
MPLTDEQYQEVCRELRPTIETLASKMADRREGQPPNSTKTDRLYWWTNRIAIGFGVLSVLFFGFWYTSDAKEPNACLWLAHWSWVHRTWYVPVCFLLYMAWMFGVPTWFSLDFFWHYKESHQSLEEFKYRQELLKSGWVSVAVVLAALFTVKTHLDLSEKPKTPEPKAAAATAPAGKK